MDSHENSLATDVEALRLQKVQLSDSVDSLFSRVEEDLYGYESEQSTYTFIDADFIEGTWLPLEIASFLESQSAALKRVDICYDVEAVSPRPRVGLTLFLTNGERIILSKDPSDFRQPGFIGSYSDESIALPEVTAHDVGHLLVSVAFAKHDKPDIVIARILAGDNNAQLDPTGELMANLLPLTLDLKADSWKKEETREYLFEDDRYEIKVVKSVGSNGLHERTVTFAQKGNDISGTAMLNLIATVTTYGPNELTLPASLSYESYDLSDPSSDDAGDADKKPHLYDFMKVAIDKTAKQIGEPSQYPSFEVLSRSLEDDQEWKSRYDP